MSYDVYLRDKDTHNPTVLDEKHKWQGGTYELGGSQTAEFNVTYNYGAILRDVLPPQGIRTLYGLTGNESMPLLRKAIATLGNDASKDYWDATEGNVKVALTAMLDLACMCPDSIWDGD
jgi:hypothetical protein